MIYVTKISFEAERPLWSCWVEIAAATATATAEEPEE